MAKRENSGWLFRVGLLALVAAVTVMLGCQPGSDEELKFHNIISKTPPALVAAVGIDVCGFCHTRQVDEWLLGQHGTAFGDLDSVGHPTYAQFLDSNGDPSMTSTGHYCYECHDPQGDGRRLEPGYTGNVDRPVIGCEACHGGGAEHYGAGNIPFAKPDAERCGQCHNQEFDHNTYHPNGDNIYEDYSMSGHSHSINSHNLAANGKDVRATCGRCHTDEGFRKYISQVPGTTGHDSIEDFFTGLPDLADSSDVTCRTCHNPHEATGDNLTRIAATNVNGDTQSSEFNTCTSCHQLVNVDGGLLAGATIIWAGTVGDSAILNGDSFGYHDPMINSHGNYDEIIPDTHAAVPGDTRLNTGANAKSLYFVKKGSNNACADCHSPHQGQAVINKQYARSGHGEPLADPWIHYDWKHSGRADCQRCHTSTGFANYADSLIMGTVYDSAANDYSYLLGNDDPGARVDTNDQSETLYCWACHASVNVVHGNTVITNSYSGQLRNPGPITAPYAAMDGSTIEFPDVSGSNVCMACHNGRASGGSIAASAADFSNTSFINSHYLTAGAIIFTAGGYEYPGLDYSNVPYYEHDIIGLPAAGATVEAAMGINGPCVGCHMHSNPEKHLFLPVSRDGDTVTGITSTGCSACHSGEHELTLTELEEQDELFKAAMEFFKTLLGGHGFNFRPSNPYFFTLPVGGSGVTNWTEGTAAWGKPNMGACFNFNLLEHDPGAFAHNRYYAKRLIYDSMDWMDDKALNDSVAARLTALAAANPGVLDGETLTRAQEYLLSATNGRP
ncbi:MAG TPA: cytochrome c3 family protein [bacterium]|nr:cytochrome c3 family protein [bacterium]